MLNAKKFVSALMACTIACSAVYSAGAGFTPPVFAATAIDKPIPSMPAGRYEHAIQVTLTTTTPGTDIYYTLDGTLPDETSLKFTGTPIALSESTNISVIAVKDGVWSTAGTYGYIIKTAEQPLLKFAAWSDVHLEPGTPESDARTRALYESNFDVLSSIFPNPDAIVIAGDLINDNSNGKGAHHTFVRDVINEQMARKNWSNLPVQVAIGNHDAAVSNVRNGYPAEWFTDQPGGYYEKTIKGYSFFFLNGNSYNGDTGQRNWLKGRLSELTSDPANRNKPIFITLHHPISGTVMDGQQATNANLNTDLKDFPQVVVLSGHSHLNINDERSIYQKDYTAVNLGSMSYIETESGYFTVTPEGLVDEDLMPQMQSQFIEVYADRIEIERVAYNGDPGWITLGGVWQHQKAPFNSAGALAGKKWVVKLTGNTNEEIKSNFMYTAANRNKVAPQFMANPDIKVLPGENNVPVLSFRQAKDDEAVHHYAVTLYDQRTAQLVKTYNVLSDFYFSPIPNKMNIPMSGLDSSKSYVINVRAVDALGNMSNPLQTFYRSSSTGPVLTPIDPATMWNQLVSDMKFDGNLNEDAAGTTGLAAQSGSVTFVTGRSGQAVHIAPGNSNYVDLGDRTDMKFGSGDFTVSFWHKGNLAGDQTVLANKNWNSGGNAGWYIGPASTGNMTLNMANGTGKRVDYSAANVGVEWHSFTISVDRTNKKASTYVDGVLAQTKDISVLGSDSLDAGYNIILGADGNKGNGGADVTLDDLKIWKRALSATEAKALSDSYKTAALYTFHQLTAKIQEAEQLVALVTGSTGVSLPAEAQSDLSARLAAAKALTLSSGEAEIDQAYIDLMWALQTAQSSIVYTFIPKSAFTIDSYSSYADNEDAVASNMLDGSESTIWHSKWETPTAPFPHWVIIDMKNTYKLDGIQRKSRLRQNALEFPKTFELYASDHKADLSDPAFLGNAANKTTGTFGKTWTGSVYADYAALDKPVQGRYVKFVVTGTYNTNPSFTFTSMSEIDFTGKQTSSSNASLTDLKVNGTTVSGFAPDKLSYAMSVPYSTTTATVTYTAASSSAIVAVTVGDSLVVGDNPITVTVTAQDGTTSVYTITVARPAQASDATLSDLKVNGNTVPNFAPGKFDYAASVPANTTTAAVTYTASSPNAQVNVEGDGEFNGDNKTITVTVTAQDGTKKDYRIVISKLAPAPAKFLTITNANKGVDLNQMTFTGNWSFGGDSWASKIDSYVEVPFYGNQVKVYGAKDRSHGIVGISIDGKPETKVDLYASARVKETYYTSPELPSGLHTIKVRVTGEKNPSASDVFAVVENVQVSVDTSYMNMTGPSGVLSETENIFDINYVGNLDQIVPDSAIVQIDPDKFEVAGAESSLPGGIAPQIEDLGNGKIKLSFTSIQAVAANIVVPIAKLKLKAKDVDKIAANLTLENLTVTTPEGQQAAVTSPFTKTVDIFDTEEITLDRETLSLKAGGFDLVSLDWTPAIVLNPSIHWISSDESVVKVEPIQGSKKQFKVMGLKAGKATISALSTNEKSVKSMQVEVSNSTDVNRDGTLTQEDKDLVQQLSGSATGDSGWAQSAKADLNGNGKVDEQDVQTIEQQLAKHNGTPYKHVFIIGLDGAGNFVQNANAPRMKKFFSEGAVTYNAKTENYSSSAPSWGAILHGVGYDTHKRDNGNVYSPFPEHVSYPSIFKLLKQERPWVNMAAMNHWNEIYIGLIERSAEVYNDFGSDSAITQKIVQRIKTEGKNTQLMFFHLDDIDGAGHSKDYGSPQYYQQYTITDGYVGNILDAIDQAGLTDDSLIIISTDHGGHNYTHATTDPRDTTIFWAAKGKGIKPGTVITSPVRGKDTAAVVAKALRLDAPAAWEGTVPQGIFEENDPLASNASLKDLQVNGTVVNGFASDKYAYTLTVPYETTVAEVTYTAVNPAARVVAVGGGPLAVGPNPVTVHVTSQDGTAAKDYRMVINRHPQAGPSNAALLDLRVNGMTVEDFAADRFGYALSVPYGTTVASVTYKAANPAASVTVNGGESLHVGANPITVKVISQDGTTTNMYTLMVTRQGLSSNASLRELSVNGLQVAGFAPDKPAYTMHVSNGTTVANVTYAAEDGAATVVVTGGNLMVGSNVISIDVTAQDGTSKRYIITVHRLADDSDDSGSSGSIGTPSPNPPVKPEQPADTASIQDEDLASGSPSVSVALTEEKNRLVIPMEQAEKLKGRLLQVQSKNIKVNIPGDLLRSISDLPPKPDDFAAVTVQVDSIPAAQAERILQEASRKDNGFYKLGGQIIDLSIFATDASGKPYSMDKLAMPVTMTFPIPAGMDPKLAGVYEMKEDGSLTYWGGKRVSGNAAIEVEVDNLSSYALLSLEKRYNDVTDDHWAYATIRELSAQHIVNGVTDAAFAPGKEISRAEFAALLARTLGLASAGTTPFGDVTGDDWFAKEVGAAYQAGIIAGDAQHMFDPNRSITREEMAVMLVRAYEHRVGSKLEPFLEASSKDASEISGWALPYVSSALRMNLLSGRQEGLFAPDEQTTRAEAAQAIYNLLQ
ncbi:cadherin-like beta sandwich domain-containing protein [Bacillus sp. 3255]|uniref:cadherin-like beta sandwich domain-containing protein n=1 Tax=Bacillus sp. 3255 TaxID=2817904 RepID=UPI00285C3FB3|nr:cadherin-like beta sandwich domain-containing protein [Bacillus sp. 3255]MDR6883695.1 putative MPP superfamily phosphohydrolase [Bacillus sp. 3255]